MNIILSNSSGKPIYEQITAQIKAQIMSGELQAGDALPSMRTLAKELRISVITTKRAYEDLERDGFLENVPGKAVLLRPRTPTFCGKKPSARRRRPFSRRWSWPGGAASPGRRWRKCWNFYGRNRNHERH